MTTTPDRNDYPSLWSQASALSTPWQTAAVYRAGWADARAVTMRHRPHRLRTVGVSVAFVVLALLSHWLLAFGVLAGCVALRDYRRESEWPRVLVVTICYTLAAAALVLCVVAHTAFPLLAVALAVLGVVTERRHSWAAVLVHRARGREEPPSPPRFEPPPALPRHVPRPPVDHF